MTTGEKLKSTLGLDNFRDVYLRRVLLPNSQKVNMVFYDSLRGNLAKARSNFIPFTAMVYSGSHLAKDEYKQPILAPAISIENWNGQPANYIFVMVDLAYQFHLDKKDFSRLPERVQKNINDMCYKGVWYGSNVLKEITLADLRDKGNVSPLTQQWRKDRTRVMSGNESKTSKLIDIVLNESKNNIVIQFLSESTTLDGKKPSKTIDSSYKLYKGDKSEVNPQSNFSLRKNRAKVYEVSIKILDFFDWLSIFEGDKITRKEVKEILEVSDVQVFSNSPAMHWQGMNFNLSLLDASMYPTNIPNKVWGKKHGDPNGYFLSKELAGILATIDFWLNPISSMLTKKLKDRGLL